MFTLRRRAARVVLLDRQDRVLLLRAADPADAAKGQWWEIPGGGMETGEDSEAAAARELYEETGIRGVEMGPCVWVQHVSFRFGGYSFDQHERVHLARCDGGVYRPAALEALEALAFSGSRWCPAGDLADLVAGGERTIPEWLAEQLPAVLADGIPGEPIDLGHFGAAI
ncbi:MAG: NUDIX hydrolase [Acidimicrobiales bacterium]